jgi:serine/threonine-protein kinase RsbW
MENRPAGSGWIREVDLPSQRGASRLVTDELLEQLGIHGWSPSDIFAIHLAAEEAIVNAIVHGNKLDPAKKVHVSCEVTPGLARICITDEGEGFDPSQAADDRLEMPGGRGVMLMKSFMTRIEYNAKGNSVLLEKRHDAVTG